MIRQVKSGFTGLAISLLGIVSAHAAGPEQELSSGPYITRVIESDWSQSRPAYLSVGEFSPQLGKQISGITDQIYFECSPTRGLLSTGDYSSFSDYIRSALIEQLQFADSYSAEETVQLSGELKKVDVYFNNLAGESLSYGTWEIQLALRSSLGGEEVFSVSHSYPIRDSNNYCGEMAGQFMASVQALMVEILGSERFDELVEPARFTYR